MDFAFVVCTSRIVFDFVDEFEEVRGGLATVQGLAFFNLVFYHLELVVFLYN